MDLYSHHFQTALKGPKNIQTFFFFFFFKFLPDQRRLASTLISASGTVSPRPGCTQSTVHTSYGHRHTLYNNSLWPGPGHEEPQVRSPPSASSSDVLPCRLRSRCSSVFDFRSWFRASLALPLMPPAVGRSIPCPVLSWFCRHGFIF